MNHIYHQQQFGLENWFNYQTLYSKIVELFPSGSTFVEVGCWKGKSSAYMAVEIINSNKEIKFYCVDHWIHMVDLGYEYLSNADASSQDISLLEPPKINKKSKELSPLYDLYDVFLLNMKPFEKYYTPLKMTSLEASKKFKDESIDFIFLDSSHNEDDISLDIKSWFPKLKYGGIMAGHDYNNKNYEIKKVVDKLLGNVINWEKEDCFIYKKK